MNTKFLIALLTAGIQCSRGEAAAATFHPCEAETDLDFVTCTLDDLSEDALRDICRRIGLDLETEVLSYLFESDNDGKVGDIERRTYHSDFVKAAEECLSVDFETDGQWYDPDELQLDSEVAITDILIQDEDLLKEIVTRLSKGRPELIEEIKSNGIMMHDEEGLEDRPDVVAFYLTSMLSDDPTQFASLLSGQYLSHEDDPGHTGGWGLNMPSNPVPLQRTHLRH